MAENLESRYGIPKDAGGDSSTNISKMENCTSKMMKSGKSKESAIRICKTSIFGSTSGATQEEIAIANAEVATAELAAVGKILSKKNLEAIKTCIGVLEDLVSLVEPSDPNAIASTIRIEGENIVIDELVSNSISDLNLSNPLKAKAHTVLEKAAKNKDVGANSIDSDMQITLTAGERLGTYLTRTRQAKNLSIDQLAKQLPIGVNAVSSIETGYNTTPPDNILQAFSDVLGCDLDELMQLRTLDQEQPVMRFGY